MVHTRVAMLEDRVEMLEDTNASLVGRARLVPTASVGMAPDVGHRTRRHPDSCDATGLARLWLIGDLSRIPNRGCNVAV